MKVWRVEAGQLSLAGRRLDQALTVLLSGLGLRGCRRLLQSGRVLLNGRPAVPASRLREGDRLELAEEPSAGPATVGEASGARLLGRQGDHVFLFKPAGMHSVALAGSAAPSLEACLPGLLADVCPEISPTAGACLLQRLDWGTSGLVCAALSDNAAQAFRDAEHAGRSQKLYAALLCGVLDGPRCVRLGLDTARRRRSRLLSPQDDPCRWTEFWPLHCWQGREAAAVLSALGAGVTGAEALTLAACRIRRGARHQIRAHAAALGLPLWGDSLYGFPAPGPAASTESGAESGAVFGPVGRNTARQPYNNPGNNPADRPGRQEGRKTFFLHHGLLRFPGAFCAALPAWPLPPEGDAALRKLFEICV